MKLTVENEARGALDIFHSHILRTCAEHKSDYKPTDARVKPLCYLMLVRDTGNTCKALTALSYLTVLLKRNVLII